MKIDDFKMWDVLIITRVFKDEKRVIKAKVQAVNPNNLGCITYHSLTDWHQSSFKPEEIGVMKKFGGLVSVEIIGNEPPPKSWYPKPGDTAYDLMC